MSMAVNSTSNGNCRFAIPKKGRLYDKVTEMLSGAGIQFRREPRLDVALCVDLPMTLVFLPASDIAKYVGEGNVDMGITGLDVVEESDVTVDRVMDLGFGKCKLCVQAPIDQKIQNVELLAGKRIVTSFPHLTKTFFDPLDAKMGTSTKINFVSGSVEAACGLDLADAVVDLVETGTTMKAAGLEIVTEILETQAILIVNPNAQHRDLVDLIKQRLEGYITATKYVLIMYNVSNTLLADALQITPGKRSATVTSLDDGESKAVSSLVLTKNVNEVMDKLKKIGATDILVMEIKNSRM